MTMQKTKLSHGSQVSITVFSIATFVTHSREDNVNHSEDIRNIFPNSVDTSEVPLLSCDGWTNLICSLTAYLVTAEHHNSGLPWYQVRKCGFHVDPATSQLSEKTSKAMCIIGKMPPPRFTLSSHYSEHVRV